MILVPWSCIAGRFELKSWSMFSDGRFLPVEVKHMIVTEKVTHYNRVNNKLAQGKDTIQQLLCDAM